MKEFWIKRDNIRETKFVESKLPTLEENQILLSIEHCAFTANNISYAQTGESLGYWQFFPTGEDGWGKLPVWGYATVLKSHHPEITLAERFFGFFPLATQFLMQPERVGKGGFVDGFAHRQALPAVYNRYARSSKTADDYLNSILRPMFVTAFLLDDYLEDNEFFGAEQILVSSASSKTAYAMAHLTHQRQQPELIGLTSAKNMDFVKSLGIYSKVLAYEELDSLPNLPSVYVDFSSNAALRHNIQAKFGEKLRHDAIVGGTHWDKAASSKGLEVDKPEFFFAPVRIQKRLADWGREGYQERTETSFADFLQAARNWVDLTFEHGTEAISKRYQSMLNGETEPRAGYILGFKAILG